MFTIAVTPIGTVTWFKTESKDEALKAFIKVNPSTPPHEIKTKEFPILKEGLDWAEHEISQLYHTSHKQTEDLLVAWWHINDVLKQMKEHTP